MNNKLTLAAGVAITSVSLYSAALSAATVNSNASANVLTPLGIANGTNSMNFGDVAGDADVDTTVVLTFGGSATSGDGASTAGTATAGDFDVTGSGTLSYTIGLPTSIVLTAQGGSGGADMTVDTFISSLGVSGSSGALGTDDSFTVGATLTINAGQLADSYSGNYDVTVEYQ